MQRTGYDAIFNSLDDLLDPYVWVRNASGEIIQIKKSSWENFNAWCDFIHIDCDPLDPEVASYDRKI